MIATIVFLTFNSIIDFLKTSIEEMGKYIGTFNSIIDFLIDLEASDNPYVINTFNSIIDFPIRVTITVHYRLPSTFNSIIDFHEEICADHYFDGDCVTFNSIIDFPNQKTY